MKSCRKFFSNIIVGVSRHRNLRSNRSYSYDDVESYSSYKEPSMSSYAEPVESNATGLHCPPADRISLEDMPYDLFEKISVHLSYGNVAQMRLVSRKMNALCSKVLTSGLHKLQSNVDALYKATKVKLPLFCVVPKRQHPLAWKAELFNNVSMKLDKLLHVFGKHIARKNCCFFAGSLLDEFYRSLWCITVAKDIEECRIVLDDLEKFCHTAKAYFVDHLKPSFPGLLADPERNASHHSFNSDGVHRRPGGHLSSNTVLKSQNRKLVAQCQAANQKLTAMRREVRGYRSRLVEQKKLLTYYQKRLADNRRTYELSVRRLKAELVRYESHPQPQRQSRVHVEDSCREEDATMSVLWKGLGKDMAEESSGASVGSVGGVGAGEAVKTEHQPQT